MRNYSKEELDAKIHDFLNRKFEKYPELSNERSGKHIFSKPSLKTRMMQSMTSTVAMPSHQ